MFRRETVDAARQKNRERFFVEEAARSLSKVWILGGDREHPDFVITEDGRQFGLEVSEIFMRPQRRGGSSMKAKESITQRSVNALRLEYEAAANVPLIVKFVGNMSQANMAAVVPALIAEDLPSKAIAHHFVLDTGNGLRVHVTKSLRCACRKSNSHIQMMKSAKKWRRQNATNGMYCSRRRRVLVN
jgi:hypothetical protein